MFNQQILYYNYLALINHIASYKFILFRSFLGRKINFSASRDAGVFLCNRKFMTDKDWLTQIL